MIIADEANSRVRVVAKAAGTFYDRPMRAGDIYRVAGNLRAGSRGDGGPAVRAMVHPAAVSLDAAGKLLIADTGTPVTGRIRVVAAASGTFYGRAMTAGDIYTVAGGGQQPFGFSGDGGPATAAGLFRPQAVATGPAGELVIADTGNQRIRAVGA